MQAMLPTEPHLHHQFLISGACCALLLFCLFPLQKVLAECPQIKPLLQQLLDRAVQLLGDELDTAALSGMQFVRPTGPTQLAPELPQIAHYLPGVYVLHRQHGIYSFCVYGPSWEWGVGARHGVMTRRVPPTSAGLIVSGVAIASDNAGMSTVCRTGLCHLGMHLLHRQCN
jgi:hypothetical protein